MIKLKILKNIRLGEYGAHPSIHPSVRPPKVKVKKFPDVHAFGKIGLNAVDQLTPNSGFTNSLTNEDKTLFSELLIRGRGIFRRRSINGLLLETLVPSTSHTIRVDNLGLGDGPGVELLAADVPVDGHGEEDAAEVGDCVVHILCVNGADGGQDEDDGDKERPQAGPDIDKGGEATHVPWAGNKFAKGEFAEDRDDVGPVN